MSEDTLGLFLVVHSEPKVGKSWLGYSSPKPVLIFDAEGRTKFLPKSKYVTWNPLTEGPPAMDGPEQICVVYLDDWNKLMQGYQWLVSGNHPFRAVVFDSLTEMQKRLIDDVSGIEQPDQQDYGQILRAAEDIIRKMRDLTLPSAAKQLDSYLVICLTDMNKGTFRPFVKGQLATVLPGHADVVGYLYVDQETGERRMLINPSSTAIAGDGTNILSQHYGPVISNPNLSEMVQTLQEALS